LEGEKTERKLEREEKGPSLGRKTSTTVGGKRKGAAKGSPTPILKKKRKGKRELKCFAQGGENCPP